MLRGRWSGRRPWATSSRPRPSWSSTASRSRSTRRAPSATTGLTPVSDYLEDYHILQTSREEPLIRAIRNGMEDADVPVETLEGRVGQGPGGDQPRYAEALEMADRAALFKHGVKEIADQHGRAVTFMAKYDMGAAGSSFHLHSSLWDRARAQAALRGRPGQPRRRCSGPGSAASSPWPASWRSSTRRRQRLQALPGGLVRAHAHRGRRRQSHLRLPALRRGRELPRGEPHPRRRRQPVSRLRGHHRRRPARRAQQAQGAEALRGQRLRGRHAASGAEDPARGRSPRSRAPRSRARPSATASSSTTCTPRASSSRPSTPR